MAENQQSKPSNDFYAKKFAMMFFLAAFLLFSVAFYYGVKTLSLYALVYSAKQVLFPALVIGFLGYLVGKLFDTKKGKRAKNSQSRIKY